MSTAVVSGGRIGDGRGTVALPARWSLLDVHAAAAAAGAYDVLVHDAGGWDGVVDVEGGEVTGDAGGRPWRWRLAPPGPVQVSVSMLEGDEAGQYVGPFGGLTARELVDVLARLEGLLGVPWADSIGRTSERLILSTHPRARGGTLLDRDPFTPDVARQGNLELDWQSWRRPLSSGGRAAPWLHVFDASAQHLGAMVSVELGHGRPVHSVGPRFDPSVFGLWRIAGGLDGVGVPSMPDAPAPWLPGREWYTTDTMVRALEVGDGLDVPSVAEAWVWPSRSRFLRGYAERLRDARRSAYEAHDAARMEALNPRGGVDVSTLIATMVSAGVVRDAVKALYTRQAGRFSMARVEGSGWYRPEWGHAVRARARCNLHRRLEKLGAAPFAIATDALVFADAEPDPVKFAERIRLPLGRQLGAYTHEGTVRACDVDADVLEGGNAVQVLRTIGEAL